MGNVCSIAHTITSLLLLLLHAAVMTGWLGHTLTALA
jgi:hypothetical protein